MKHLILFLFIASLATGVGSMIVGNLFYITNKNKLLKYLLRAAYSLTFLLIIDIINFYKWVNNIIYTEFQYLLIIFGLLIAGASLVYAFGHFTYELIQKPLTKRIKSIYIASCIAAFASLFVLHMLYKLNIAEEKICIRTGFFIQNFYTASGAVYCIWLLAKFRKKIEYTLSRVIAGGIKFLLVMLPVSLFSNFLEFFTQSRFPKPFSPIIYFILNVMGIYFVKSIFVNQGVKQQVPSASEAAAKKQVKIENKTAAEQKAAIKNETADERETIGSSEEGIQSVSDYLSQLEITEREKEIIEYILAGHTNSEIGEKLFISPNTVKNHIYNIYKKMNVKNRYELIHNLTEPKMQIKNSAEE